MPEILIVLDTHVLLGAITHSDQVYENAYNVIIERDNDKLLISERIIKQYRSIIHKYGYKAPFLISKLEHLNEIKKIKKIGKGKIKPVNIKGLETNDRPFVELACGRAKYLVTNDPHFHKKEREFKNKCSFKVTYPENYAENEEQ